LLAEKAVENGRVDAVFLARPSVADPESARKFFEGRRKEIRQCICCDYCTIQLFNQYEVKCAINPDIGPIQFRPMRKVTNGKKVLVVGAGVGGMEAARLADWCGHQVILCEKRNEPGGMVQGASSLPRFYTRDLANILKWQKYELSVSSVEMKLGIEVTPEMVRELGPDAIILATGAVSDGSEIPGHDHQMVMALEEYLMGDKKTGDHVAVIGGAVGAEPALSLAKEGKTVTVLEEGPQFGPLKGVAFQSGLASAPWMYLYRTFWVIDEMSKTPNATVHTEVTIKAITSEGVKFADDKGQDRSVPADSVILASGRRPNSALKESLRDLDIPVYELGDCLNPGTIRDAIYGAHHVVRDQLNDGLD
jgi:NADPH-dependent 2,4-dienoyl-CoA reductase/sulfur reductase-like enzyme